MGVNEALVPAAIEFDLGSLHAGRLQGVQDRAFVEGEVMRDRHASTVFRCDLSIGHDCLHVRLR